MPLDIYCTVCYRCHLADVIRVCVFVSVCVLQARSKLPKKRRRVLPAEHSRRGPRREPGGFQRRMNAIKHHPNTKQPHPLHPLSEYGTSLAPSNTNQTPNSRTRCTR